MFFLNGIYFPDKPCNFSNTQSFGISVIGCFVMTDVVF